MFEITKEWIKRCILEKKGSETAAAGDSASTKNKQSKKATEIQKNE
jgi:hypothetical protein